MRESKNESLLPHLSPPVARTINTQHARQGEGVMPCYYGEVDAEDGPLVASFPSVKFVGAPPPPPSYNSWRRW